ncbi:MAG: hypothetical protein H7A24_10040 [Leptospiraceae bacterium]|nr:hypothetical protein [Leptospiraceae bacterium]MCP5512210.1 hypothetical protein [Leptospiraceae bacterium]
MLPLPPTKFKENTVYLIGGGSGDPSYLTLEAHSILSQAEVVLHDMYLEALEVFYPNSEWIHVGKKKGIHSKKQSEINDLLVNYAKSGKKTVRLKAGDLSFFARSSEELNALRENNISSELIPGISSPQLLAKKLNESLTHRESARSISYWSGYWDKEISPVDIPNTEAHIIFMGHSRIFDIIDKFLQAGKPPETSFIIGSNLGRETNEVIVTNLREAKSVLTKNNFINPLLIAIGLNHINEAKEIFTIES